MTTAADLVPVPQSEWRDIPGYEGLYQASADGQVRSLDRVLPHRFKDGRVVMTRRAGCVLVGSVNKMTRYRMVALQKDGKRRMRPVHTLVLEAFAGPRPPGMEGCHIDGTRDNNSIANLYWGTRKENVDDMVRAQRRGARKCRICHKDAQIRYQARKEAGLVRKAS